MESFNAPSVFGWAADQAGCGYYRIGLPLQEMRGIGMHAEASTGMPDHVMEQADVIIGQRVCLKGASETWQKLCKAGKPTIFEIDDDLWHIHPSNKQAYFFFQKDGMLQRLTDNCAAAKIVTCSTEKLAEVIRPINPNVRVIPNYINENLIAHERPSNDHLTVGWAGSATHEMDIKVAASYLKTFFGRYPQAEMHFIGKDYNDLVGAPRVSFTDWSVEVEQYQKAMDFDIGLAPLKRDPFNDSKSYIKCLEYAALGIPVVASNTGPYRDFVKQGETGYLIGKDESWLHALISLAKDPELREQMGEAGKKQAAEYTIQNNFTQWLQVYVEAANT